MTDLRIANRNLSIAGIPPLLRVFQTDPRLSPPQTLALPSKITTPKLTTRATGQVAGRDRRVTCRFNPDSIVVEVEDVAEILVALDGSSIEIGETRGTVHQSIIDEAVLGPALILALGLQGVTTMHAGSVAQKDGVISFLGRSGSGKSTLAAYMDQQPVEWSRCTDDLLPVDQAHDGVDALPHFPQLKLSIKEQWGPPRPERLPLRALYILGEESSPGLGVAITALSSTDATVAILEHTAAWTLFPPEMTGRHLAFCAHIAETVPVRRLTYPRRFEALPEAAAAVRMDLGRSVSTFDH